MEGAKELEFKLDVALRQDSGSTHYSSEQRKHPCFSFLYADNPFPEFPAYMIRAEQEYSDLPL